MAQEVSVAEILLKRYEAGTMEQISMRVVRFISSKTGQKLATLPMYFNTDANYRRARNDFSLHPRGTQLVPYVE